MSFGWFGWDFNELRLDAADLNLEQESICLSFSEGLVLF
jgi:hypothetical protein